MNTKMIIIGVAVIAIVALGGYFIFMNKGGAAGTGQNATSTADRVEAQDVVVGEGTEATPGTVVSVLYVGRLADGTVFDSSEAHGNEALKFQLGAPGIIPGFQVGINGMRVGGERRMAIPASLGYGAEDVKDPASGNIVIPANSSLVFEVKLVKVEPAPATPPPATP